MKKPKSSIEDLKEIFEKDFKASYIAEPLYSFDNTADAQEVKELMIRKDFDVIGIREGGLISGYANRRDLNGAQLGNYSLKFDEQEKLPDIAPISEVFNVIKRFDHVFVTAFDDRVSGIITPGDLEKMPVRMWLFSLISLIEMQMLRIIKKKYSGNSWREHISSDERIKDAEKIFKELQKENKEIELVDCIQFCDKRDIISKSKDITRNLEQFDNKKDFVKLLKQLEKLRNNLAHAQNIITDKWPNVVILSKKAEELLGNFEAIKYY